MLNLQELKKKWGIGLTGGIACGKSTVAQILRKKSFLVIDADELAREAVKPSSRGLARVVEEFSGAVLNEDGTLNRRAIADIIFRDPQKRQRLEQIVHPIIHELLAEHLRKAGLFSAPRFWFYEASLLFEKGTYSEFRQIWAVSCPPEVQMARIQTRDHRSQEMAKAILASQIPAAEKARRADVVIETTSSMEELETKIRMALESMPGRSGIMQLQQSTKI